MGLKVVSIGILLLILLISYCQAELTPPYFNLATGRRIYATATCGQDTEGPELYCRSVGVNAESEYIDHSVCDFCDTNVPAKSHPPLNAIDGTDSWWQSPPLSRGIKFNEVNMTISFEQEFHVAYLFIRMGNSPRPGIWTLEKSTDYGKTWTPWQHFSDTPANCETDFGKDTYKPITRDDDVICTTEYSKIVPLENGEIPVMLLNERPSSTNYFNSTVLQEWTRATNVRIRLLRTKNLLGHLRFVTGQDPTVLRHYFYSIKDISIGGRCICNGHAEACDVEDPKSPLRILACRCQHHTCGINCNECCPGFEQKKWRQNTNDQPFNCEPCNCHGHSNECKYDEEVNRKGLSLDIHGHYDGGGVCQNCQHNTVGINCNKCKPKYYRPKGKHWNETDVCSPCQCDFFFSTGHCEEETGNCECRAAFQPPSCDSCAYGYYGYPNCRECECNLNGTNGYHCEAESGQQCPCKINFAGAYCKQCAEGYYGFPECKACECNKIGSISNDCNMTTGECKCLTNFGGHNCERCKHGYFNYPTCSHCDCDDQGTESEICNKQSGQCICREGFGGPKCDQCLPGFLIYPICTSCNCSLKRGLFFNNQKAYVKLFEHFNVGTEMKISFDFRPRDPNGLLFSVHGKSSYAILELVDNTLFFTVKTDLNNIVRTNYKLPNNESFCDGKTRNVQAIKSHVVIIIAVDFISSNPGVGGEGSVVTKTNRPLFLGGHLNFTRLPGISGQKKGFKGCISNVSVNQRMLNITPLMVFGDIWHGFCPLN